MAGHDLTLAPFGDPQYAGWVADPTRALGPFGPGGFLKLKYAVNGDLPWNSGGGANDLRALSLAFYLKVGTALGSGYWIFNFGSTAGGGFAVTLNAGKVFATRHQTGSNVNLLSTTDIQNSEAMVVLTCDAVAGGKFRMYVNGPMEAEVTLTENIARFTSQPTLWWGANYGGFTSQPGYPGLIGRTEIWDKELTGAEAAAVFLDYQTIYPGL